ncbi:galactoside alpha-(1,2)-fucosyltransferase 2-like [Protopterus annectens]|uniref:galactoside alpha-(1,2)-fucosyltransferase 2-like n=1 Tax=Protopterus annectens TaxID=7888 RepID=UPI001CFB8194|nr:galactoside alpha-(1,2)-fucosyltransferase 2-like [Protopterus annectens]
MKKIYQIMMKLKIPVFIICFSGILFLSLVLHLLNKHHIITEGEEMNVHAAEGKMSDVLSEINTIRKDKGMLIINSVGRLGNQMGEYATLYALSKINRRQAYIIPEMFNYLSPLFRITMPTINGEEVKRISWREYKVYNWMAPEYRQFSEKYVRLTGTPCSWTIFHYLRDDILREFTFHDHIKKEANNYLQKIKGDRKSVTFISVHVRRGDYVHVMSHQWKGVIADRLYLEKAMSYFRNKYQDALFVVASNGMDWCKDNINASMGDVHFLDAGDELSPGKDLSILAHCNHTVMTLGTFGFWAAYLAGGETVYLGNFTLPDSILRKEFRDESAFLPEWIGFQADLSPLLSHH